MFNRKRIEDAHKWLEERFKSTGEILQSPDVLIAKLDEINAKMAWAGEQKALAKKYLNKAKLDSYSEFIKTYGSDKFTPSILKDYINSYCYERAFDYDLTDRLTSTLAHLSDNLRTAISALKEQAKLEGYSQRVPVN